MKRIREKWDSFGEIRTEWRWVSRYTRRYRWAVVWYVLLGWWPSLVIHLLQFVGAFLLILYYDPTLALLALAGAPITLLGSVFLLGRIRRHNKEMRQVGAELTAFHSETFQNLQTIKSFGVIDAYFRRLEREQKKQKEVTLKHNLFSVLTASFSGVLGLAVGGLCFFLERLSPVESRHHLWRHVAVLAVGGHAVHRLWCVGGVGAVGD